MCLTWKFNYFSPQKGRDRKRPKSEVRLSFELNWFQLFRKWLDSEKAPVVLMLLNKNLYVLHFCTIFIPSLTPTSRTITERRIGDSRAVTDGLMLSKEVTWKGTETQIGEDKRQLRRSDFLNGLKLHFTWVTHPGLIFTPDFLFLTGLLLLRKTKVCKICLQSKKFSRSVLKSRITAIAKRGFSKFLSDSLCIVNVIQ